MFFHVYVYVFMYVQVYASMWLHCECVCMCVGPRGQHKVFFSFETRSLSLASGAHQGKAADQESPRHLPVSASPPITWLCEKEGFIF